MLIFQKWPFLGGNWVVDMLTLIKEKDFSQGWEINKSSFWNVFLSFKRLSSCDVLAEELCFTNDLHTSTWFLYLDCKSTMPFIPDYVDQALNI